MERIVRQFCPKLPSDHPGRVEKLLNNLNLDDALKLYMILPSGILRSTDLSSRSKLKPYMLDFIEDARAPPIRMPNDEILSVVLRVINSYHNWEEKLQIELEKELAQKQLEMNKEQMRRGKKDLNSSIAQIKKRFKLKTPQGKKQKSEKEKDKNTSAQGVSSLISSISGSGLASSAVSGDSGDKLASSQQTREVSFHDGLSSSYHDHLSSSQHKKDDEDEDENEDEEMDEET